MKEEADHYRQLLPLLLIIFIDTLGYFIVLPVILRLFMHGSDSLLPANTSMMTRNLLYSFTLMLSPLAFIICSPLIGHFSDRYGRKKALTYALLAACIGFLLPIVGIFKKVLPLIFIGRFIAGASSSSQPVAQAGMTDITTGKARAFYLSLIGFAMTFGMVIGPLSGSYLSDHTLVSWFNVTTPYYFALLLSFINIIMIITLYKNTYQPLLKKRLLSPRLLTKNNIWLLMLSFLFLEIAWSQYYQASFLTMTQHFHYSMNKMGIFAAYMGFWMCIGLTIVYNQLLKNFSIEFIAKSSLCVASLALLFCNIPNTAIQWIMMIPATIAVGTSYPSLLSLLSHRTETTHQGYILGCASTVLGVAWMLTGLLSGPLSQWGFAWPNILSAVSIIIGYGLCRHTVRHARSGIQ